MHFFVTKIESDCFNYAFTFDNAFVDVNLTASFVVDHQLLIFLADEMRKRLEPFSHVMSVT